ISLPEPHASVGGSMSDLQPLPAFLMRHGPIQVKERSEPSFLIQIFLALILAAAILAIGAAGEFYYRGVVYLRAVRLFRTAAPRRARGSVPATKISIVDHGRHYGSARQTGSRAHGFWLTMDQQLGSWGVSSGSGREHALQRFFHGIAD